MPRGVSLFHAKGDEMKSIIEYVLSVPAPYKGNRKKHELCDLLHSLSVSFGAPRSASMHRSPPSPLAACL